MGRTRHSRLYALAAYALAIDKKVERCALTAVREFGLQGDFGVGREHPTRGRYSLDVGIRSGLGARAGDIDARTGKGRDRVVELIPVVFSQIGKEEKLVRG